jgi:transposase
MSQKSAKILAEYLEKTGYSIATLAQTFKIARFTLYRWLDGQNVHPRKADHIEKVTKGVIKASDLL